MIVTEGTSQLGKQFTYLEREPKRVKAEALLGPETVVENSCRLLPKYREEHKGEKEGAPTKEAA